ncbi:hypothetical protein CLV68_4014, partial [Actinokineospora cianjurensis]
MQNRIRTAVVIAAIGALALTAAACGSSDKTAAGSSAATTTTAAPMTTTAAKAAAAASDLVGPGCADYAKAVPSGAGSVSGMAADPVAVAAGNNPL